MAATCFLIFHIAAVRANTQITKPCVESSSLWAARLNDWAVLVAAWLSGALVAAKVQDMSAEGLGEAKPALKRARRSLDVDDFEAAAPSAGPHASCVMKPKGSASASWDQTMLPEGPRTYPELFQWHHDVIKRLLTKFPRRESQQRGARIRVQMTSSYSGIGVAEIAASFVQDAFKRHNMMVDLVCHSQTEKDEHCQGLLGATHVFDDILARASEKLVKKLRKIQDKYVKRAEAVQKKTSGKGKTIDHGHQFLQEACRLLEDSRDDFSSSGHCNVCHADCQWAVTKQGADFWMECAGNTCTPFSSRGKKLGFLDPENIVALVWAYSLKHNGHGLPDIIINENVPGFDAKKFFRLIFPMCAVGSAVFSPADLGIPTHRPRRYTMVCPDRASRLFGVIEFSEALLGEVCFRQIHLRGSIYLQAPQEDIKVAMDELAESRGLSARPAGKSYRCKYVMMTGDRLRMEQYRERRMQDNAADMDVNIDCSQTTTFGGYMQLMPTLLKNSSIYNLEADRLYLLTEVMAAQGFPRFLASDLEACDHLPDEDFYRTFDGMVARRKKGMLGNAMCVSQVGCAIAIAFLAAFHNA